MLLTPQPNGCHWSREFAMFTHLKLLPPRLYVLNDLWYDGGVIFNLMTPWTYVTSFHFSRSGVRFFISRVLTFRDSRTFSTSPSRTTPPCQSWWMPLLSLRQDICVHSAHTYNVISIKPLPRLKTTVYCASDYVTYYGMSHCERSQYGKGALMPFWFITDSTSPWWILDWMRYPVHWKTRNPQTGFVIFDGRTSASWFSNSFDADVWQA